MNDDELVALLSLLAEHPTARWPTLASKMARRRSTIAVWEQLHPPTLDGHGEHEGTLERLRDSLARWRESGVDVIGTFDERYPLALRDLQQAPSVLFVKGWLVVDQVGVSVVGSRDASSRGIAMAADIARGLVDRGLSVISGLAAGIDTAAHRATLAAGGRAVGVLGTGVDRVYPEASRGLHERVAAAGALVSQFLPGRRADKDTLLMRNATMAGLSRASVIVEAGERSGSRVHAAARCSPVGP